MGVTLTSFHSSGKIPVSIDLAKITVRDGETILSNPAEFLSLSLDKSLQTTSSDGAANENEVSVGVRYVSSSMSDAPISEASLLGLSPIVEKRRFNSSAVSGGSVQVCSAILISKIFPTLFECREESSLIKYHVFLGFDLLSSRLSIRYLRLAFLISLFVWFRDRLY